MSNRELAKALIDQIPESRLFYVISYLQGAAVPDEAPSSGALETMQLLANPELAEKLIDGKNTPLSDCVPESEVNW